MNRWFDLMSDFLKCVCNPLPPPVTSNALIEPFLEWSLQTCTINTLFGLLELPNEVTLSVGPQHDFVIG